MSGRVAQDLTKDTQALVQSTLLGELLENARIGALAADNGVYVAANEYACELLGYERLDLIGTRVGELHPLSELPGQFEEIERGLREGGELTITRKDGAEIKIGYRTTRTTLAGFELILALFWPV